MLSRSRAYTTPRLNRYYDNLLLIDLNHTSIEAFFTVNNGFAAGCLVLERSNRAWHGQNSKIHFKELEALCLCNGRANVEPAGDSSKGHICM